MKRYLGKTIAAFAGLIVILHSAAGPQEPPQAPQAAKGQGTAPASGEWTASKPVDRLTPLQATAPQKAFQPPESRQASRGGLSFNFEGAPLADVLDYLSRAAGLAIIKDTEIDARVSIVSHRSLTEDEALDLLNAVLYEKGYAAIRMDRALRVVKRDSARTQDIPVQSGSNPQDVQKKDEFVTQIIPVQFVDARELLTNIQPLLDASTSISANQSSNSIVMTDTLRNVRRVMEIIQALDTAVADISEVRVFTLKHAKASDTATIINQVFNPDQQGSSRTGSSLSSRGFSGFPFSGGFPSGGGRSSGRD